MCDGTACTAFKLKGVTLLGTVWKIQDRPSEIRLDRVDRDMCVDIVILVYISSFQVLIWGLGEVNGVCCWKCIICLLGPHVCQSLVEYNIKIFNFLILLPTILSYTVISYNLLGTREVQIILAWTERICRYLFWFST